MAKRPAFQFYPSDWRNDPGLRLCSVGARGLWMDMLCLMHEGQPYGHLTVLGRPIDAPALARLVGESPGSIRKWLKELRENEVYSIDETGVIFSRRMVRDEDLRERRAAGGAAGAEHGQKGAQHGAKGGRPAKEKAPDDGATRGDNKGGEKPPLKPPPSSSSSLSSSAGNNGGGGVARDDRAGLPADVRAVIEAAGWTHPPGDIRLLKDWYRLAEEMFGQPPQTTLDQDIVPVVRRETDKLRSKGSPPRLLKVFDAAIREKLAKDQAEIEHYRKVAARNGGTLQ